MTSYQDPQLVYNDLYVDVNEAVLLPTAPAIATFQVPGRSDAYFFSGTQYVEVQINTSTRSIYISNGPLDLATGWPALAQAGFSRVDAVPLNPQNSSEEAYFFSGRRYVLIRLSDNSIVEEPQEIVAGGPLWRKPSSRGLTPPHRIRRMAKRRISLLARGTCSLT